MPSLFERPRAKSARCTTRAAKHLRPVTRGSSDGCSASADLRPLRSSRTLPRVIASERSLKARYIACAVSACTLLGCTDATYGTPDLPADWKQAVHIEDFRQSDCSESVDDAEDSIAARPGDGDNAGKIEVDYEHAAFRCQQDLEAYVRKTDQTLDVLVQPINLNPPFIARCSCRYQLSFVLPGPKPERYPAGNYRVNVFRRSDNINQPNDPAPVGGAEVELP